MKSTAITYLIWFFFGFLGLHKFYLRDYTRGWIWVGIWVISFITLMIPVIQIIGGILWLFLSLMWLADLFFIPGYVDRYNAKVQADNDARLLAIIKESKS